MITIYRHTPTFIERDALPSDKVKFDTMDQLLTIPWVAQWRADPDFHQFSVSAVRNLMAELRGGREWWVIGNLDGDVAGLPEWNGGIHEVWSQGKASEVPGNLVLSICGDDVTLHSGEVLKRRKTDERNSA